MVRPQLNTMIFRLVVSLSIPWVIVASVQGISDYNALTPYVWTEAYREATQRCGDERFSLNNVGEWALQRPPEDEMAACIDRERRSFKRSERSEKTTIAIITLRWALIPAILLLALAAFYSALLRGAASLGSSYARWLRGSGDLPK